MPEPTRGGMVKEGYYFGVPLLLVGGVAYLLHWYAASAVLVFLSLFVFSFFRDPERAIPSEPGAVVSPGDGRTVVVADEEHEGRAGKRVSIFLAVWHVHVNRSPAAGTITNPANPPRKIFSRPPVTPVTRKPQKHFTPPPDPPTQ